MRNTMLFLMLLFAGVSNAGDPLPLTSPCPGLVSSYAVEKLEPVLVVTDSDFASVEDCEQLGQFFFEEPRRDHYSLDYSRLGAIVDDIWRPVNEDSPYLLIDALLSWMRGMGLEQHAESFRNFIADYLPAEENVRLFFTLVIWMIISAVVLLVLYEFYRAGMLKFPRRQPAATDEQKPESTPALSWDALLGLPARRQIGVLLQYSIERLAAKDLIPASRSLTNHELMACLEKSDARQASLLREQIEQTEPVVYGDVPVSEEQLACCRAIARRIKDAR
ncbi:MAG: DUF4129 domain-containing protein [Gammaproteobacteria bacterium]|jgi:hypothetical protein